LHFQSGFSCGAIVTPEIFAGPVANFRQLEQGRPWRQLGRLVNGMRTSDECEPFTFGIGAVMRNLTRRKIL
jgi:hypothetical protein